MDRSAIPADASVLIYLAKADVFAVAHRCIGALVATPAVWREAVEAGERKGAPEVGRIRVANGAGQLVRVHLAQGIAKHARELSARHQLGHGESEVLALGRRGGEVLVDEGRATRVAESLGLVPISTLFVPVLGAVHGQLDEPAARDLLHRLAVVTGAQADVILSLESILRRLMR